VSSIPPKNLTACDREPIHILGAIQPFGFLLSVNADWLVARASENVEEFIGIRHAQVVGQSAEACLSAVLLHEIRSRLQVAGGMGIVERLYGQRLRTGGARFDIAVHQSGREVILEFDNRQYILNFAMSRHIPVVSGWAVMAQSGAICTYGPRLVESYRRVAYLVDRILQGAKPVELPIEQPTALELVVNVKSAKILGLTIPPAVLGAGRYRDRIERSLLRCMSPLMAQSGHPSLHCTCPLLGVKRTKRRRWNPIWLFTTPLDASPR
jgi:PAS fold/ABC transporter substrate binding protein